MAGYLKPELCKNCNLTESKFYIEVENEDDGNKLINFLNSNKIMKYLELCKYSGFNSRPFIENISYDTLTNVDIDNDNENENKDDTTNKIVKRSISNKIKKGSDSEEEKPKVIKVKKNKRTLNKTK